LLTDDGRLLRFQFSQVQRFLKLESHEKQALAARLDQAAPSGFQIWGVPEGAKHVIREVKEGDAFLLLRTWGEEGRFGFVGRVIGVPHCHAGDASRHFWGEDRFPLLLFLDGCASEMPWREFRQALGYKPNWDPRGQTYTVKEERLKASPFLNVDGLLRAMTPTSSIAISPISDALLSDLIFPEADTVGSPEGGKRLVEHAVRERDPTLVHEFKRRLRSFSCTICEFDFGKKYGLLGDSYIEAHHLQPVGEMREGDITTLDSLIAVCSNCHRMLHRRWPPLQPDDVRRAISDDTP
jgi:5-methylcytosine-specific restriction enzyme A